MKALSIISAVLLFNLFACTTPQQDTTQTDSNVRLVKEFFEHFNKHDWQKMANMYADTVEFKDPSFGTKSILQTRLQTIQKYTELNKIFSNLNDKIIALYPSGNKHIIVEFISSGTAADGTKFELPICTIFTIENNLITKDYTYYDNFEE